MTSFIDTSLVLDLVEATPRGRRFEVHLSDPTREWCISPLVLMECRVRPLAENDLKAQTQLEEITRSMTFLRLTDTVFDRAAHVRARTGLKSLDALHVATALEHGCAEVWTADARLARAIVPDLDIRLVV